MFVSKPLSIFNYYVSTMAPNLNMMIQSLGIFSKPSPPHSINPEAGKPLLSSYGILHECGAT